MKKYNEYIDVGLPWYPHGIPSHWSLVRHKNVLIEHKELVGENSANYTLLSLTLNGVIIRDISEGKGKFAKDYDKYVVVDEGDFVFCLFDVEETPRTVGLSKHRGMITGAYDVFKPHGINPEYFYYYYLALDNVKALKPLYSGLRKVIPYPSFMAMKVPVPPKNEQDQIVRYLDWKVSNINRMIHGYQRQIDLLEERKRSFAFNAVTQGLQANSAKTESPLYWLESIPSHWDTNSIAQLFTEVKNKNKGMQENNLLSLSYGTIKRRNIDATEGLLPASFEGYNIIEKDDIVLRLTDLQNDHKSLRTGIATERGIITSAYLTIRNKSDNNSEFLQLFLHAFDLAKGFYNVGASGVRQSLNWDTVKMLKVLIPSIPEQNQIVEAIKAEYEKIGTAIESVKQQIELLREYRTRLISDVVTGQVDVRGVEIPDYTPEEDNVVYDENNDTEEVTDSAD